MAEVYSEDAENLIEKNLRKTLLVGIGNEYRNDDGVGLMVTRAIKEKQFSSIVVKEESGEGAALMDAWQGFQNVILVDAVSSGAEPGTIFKIDAREKAIPSRFFHSSTHAFSVAESVELARVINVLPPKLAIYGIEGSNFDAGTALSHSVLQAAHELFQQIVNEIESLS